MPDARAKAAVVIRRRLTSAFVKASTPTRMASACRVSLALLILRAPSRLQTRTPHPGLAASIPSWQPPPCTRSSCSTRLSHCRRVTARRNPRGVLLDALPDGTVRWEAPPPGRPRPQAASRGRSRPSYALHLIRARPAARLQPSRSYVRPRRACSSNDHPELGESERTRPLGNR